MIDHNFATSNVKNDGMLNKEELKSFLEAMNDYTTSFGLKSHERTDELIDKYWECFTKYTSSKEGVT